jgi:hypothetical protein
MVKTGLKSTELWLTLISGGLLMFWPDFPKESLIAVWGWIVARGAQKGFGIADGKRPWMTTEFWATIAFSAANLIFPDLPQESLVAVLGYVGSRTIAKKQPPAPPTT